VGVYNVLVYGGEPSLPAVHLVAASDATTASAIADDLLVQSPDGVGVEVVCDGKRLYARGVVPVSAPRALSAISDASAERCVETRLLRA